MVPHVSSEKMSINGLNCLKKDGAVLRIKTGLEGQNTEVRSPEVIKSINNLI